jgi:outer membrane lipoprotein-sorting protein
MHKRLFFPCIIFLLLLAALAGGCIRQTVIYPDSPLEKILAAISGVVAEEEILSATARIDLVTIHGYQPAKAALIIKKPSYLRLELLPVIGTPDFFLVASPEKMNIYIPSKGEFYRGNPTQANLAKFLPWQINIEDMAMIFTGTYPSLKEKVISYQSYREKDFLRIEMKTQSGCLQTIWVGEHNRLRKLVRRDEDGKEIYHVQYDNHGTEGIAGKITISMADGITSLSIKYSDIKIEKATDLSIFDLPVPADIKVIPLE